MTDRSSEGSLRNQLRHAASEASPVPERADVMAKALFALKFADRWLAEYVEEPSLAMRSGEGQLRRTYTAIGRDVEVVIEAGVDRRVTGAIAPAAPGWILLRSGSFRDLVRLDEEGMFTSAVPLDTGPIDLVVELDDGATITITGLDESQAP